LGKCPGTSQEEGRDEHRRTDAKVQTTCYEGGTLANTGMEPQLPQLPQLMVPPRVGCRRSVDDETHS